MTNELPADGSIFSFHTRPFSDFAPPVTNRFGALKVLGSNSEYVIIAVLDRTWNEPPSAEELHSCGILREQRFSFTGTPAVRGVFSQWWDPFELTDFTFVGISALSIEEIQFRSAFFNKQAGTAFSTLSFANYSVEGEWRWANDREAFRAEQQQRNKQRAAQREAEQERLRNRLLGLTWDQLLDETPFERWCESPPFPCEEFTREARKVILDTCRALRDLGEKPRRPDVRKLLRQCVEWFNHADEQAGGVIETEEREDICSVLEEMTYVARQRTLMNEVEDWRTW